MWMNRLLIVLLLVGGIAIQSCTQHKYRFTLKRAGSNSEEINKVIKRYNEEGDLQKIEALNFILTNLPYQSFLYSEGLVKAKDWFRLMRERPFSELQDISDSIENTIDVYNGLQRKWDVQVLDSAYLCENIDMAFKVWREQPWGKNVSFDMFCKYILPYRIGDEIPELWRKDYYEEFNSLLDDFRNSDTLDIEDPVEAYKYLASNIPIIHNVVYTSITPVAFPHIGPSYVRYNTGGCREFCDFMIYVCRSLGIPCALNCRLNDGHHWNTYWNKEAEEYVVSYYPKVIVKNADDNIYNSTKLRVFRYSYEINKKEIAKLPHNREILPQLLRIPLFEDVTSHFTRYYEDKLVIPDSLINVDISYGDVLYLCTNKRDNWAIEDYATNTFGPIKFGGVQRGMLMCVALIDNGTLRPITEPFLLDTETSQIKLFRPEKSAETVILKSKYPIEGNENELREMMRNGVFEASSTIGFEQPDTLAIIQLKPDRQISNIYTYNRSRVPYKYVRYKGPKGSYCGVAEVAFYDIYDNPVEYRQILGTASIDPDRTILNVYDGNPSTSYDYYYPDGGWCGLELLSDTIIGRITYTPRNRVNYIYANNQYELFYYEDGWNSLGRKIADADSLVYNNVPKGSLLYLKNQTTGVQEMSFSYENGRQIFYGYGMENHLKKAMPRVSHHPWKCRYSFLTPSSSWVRLDYDDSLWESGNGPFGTDERCATKWSSKNLFIRYYFCSDSRDSLNYTMLKKHTYTSSKVYLNGTEITSPDNTNYCLPLCLINDGENVLAIKCVNNNLSDNVLCDIDLSGTK